MECLLRTGLILFVNFVCIWSGMFLAVAREGWFETCLACCVSCIVWDFFFEEEEDSAVQSWTRVDTAIWKWRELIFVCLVSFSGSCIISAAGDLGLVD